MFEKKKRLRKNLPAIDITNTLIIEEPEAHLHPELQQKMARLIVNLVNRNIPVWITMHSDTILQHINNMIKLNNHESRRQCSRRLGLSKTEEK